MEQLFLPPELNPLASRVNTLPYVDNICNYLSLSSAQVYSHFIKYFEEDRVTENTLALMIRDANFFDNQPHAQYLHDDLALVIILNKLGNTDEFATPVLGPATDNATNQKVTPGKSMAVSLVGKRDEGETLAVMKEKAQQMAMSAAGLSNVAFYADAIFKMSGCGLKRLPPCETCSKRKVRCGHEKEPGDGVGVGHCEG